MSELSHFDRDGNAVMVDVGAKEVTLRVATAAARVLMQPATLALIEQRALAKGDVLTVEYEPGKGTTIRGNALTAGSRAPHGLMVAFLDQWLGQRPVSEDLKRTLLEWSPPASVP